MVKYAGSGVTLPEGSSILLTACLTSEPQFAQIKMGFIRNSLAVQGLGLGVFTAGAWVQSPIGELRSCMPRGVAKKKKKNS